MHRDDTLRIFISSTFVDLNEYRQAVFDAIVGSGLVADNMIYWSADERAPVAVSVDKVRESNAVVLLVAHRYGCVPEGSNLSITEQEYNAARAAKIPVLAFVVDESVPWPPHHIEWEQRERLQAFKQRLMAEVVARGFNSKDHLASLATQALANLTARLRYKVSAPAKHYPAMPVDSAASLTTKPDLNVQIGTAVDGLPPILEVHRSRETAAAFATLEQLASSHSYGPPTALLNSFRQLIEEHAREAWASGGMQQVRMLDGSVGSMFVTPAPLVSLFRSTLASLLTAVPP